MRAREWNLAPRDPAAEEALARDLGVSRVMATLLRNRRLDTPRSARDFLTPRMKDLEDPFRMLDMDRAAERLASAIRGRERIVVYGDYDVDGMTGTVILLKFIALAGGDAGHYIPNRLTEGYSFSEESLERILGGEAPPGVVVTVDHGTSSVGPIRSLREAGVDVIVTDHHEPPSRLPDAAHALVNPRRPGCPSEHKDPCGATMAFKLAWATAQRLSGATRVSDDFRRFLMDAMSLVALATVTDVVPMRFQNRILCHHGLQALARTTNPGLSALLKKARLRGKPITALHCGFQLGPRINAAGRMGIQDTVIEMLTTQDEARARELSEILEEANTKRKAIERSLLQEIERLPEILSFHGGHGICLGAEGWHLGVIGIAAARLVDRFGVPTLLAAFQDGRGRASARAAGGVHLRDVLERCSEHLLEFGGHAGAAGCSLEQAAFPAFKEAFAAVTAEAMESAAGPEPLELDLELPFRQIRISLLDELERLSPYGPDSPEPLFVSRGLEVAGTPRTMGQDQTHLSFNARGQNRIFRAVWFGSAHRAEALRRPFARVDVAYHLKRDTFRGTGAVELEVVDVRDASQRSRDGRHAEALP